MKTAASGSRFHRPPRTWPATPKTIRAKLLMAFITIGLLLVISIGGLSYFSARNALRNEAFTGIEALRETRSEQILLWFSDRQRDVQALSANPTVVTSARSAINSLDDGADTEDRRAQNLKAIAAAYRFNPDLWDAGDGSIYSAIHNRAHGFYQEIRDINHYSDILIVSPNGDVVYTVNKHADFATNVFEVQHESLLVLFQQAIGAETSSFTTFTDITFYEPANIPVVFFASPIFSGANKVGVLILELPIDTLNTILNLREGLGETGETYIVGNDHLFRNDSRFLDSLGLSTTILNSAIRVDTEASRSALSSHTDTRIITGYRDVPVLSAWKPLVLQAASEDNPTGVVWALLVEKEISEVEEPANDLLASILLISVVVSLAALGLAYVISSQIANPVRQLTEMAERIASGEIGQEVAIDSQDEVGILARSFNNMTGQLRSLIDSLEERVNARTRDLQIASNVSKQITTVLDIDRLLQQVVMLTASSFNFHLVCVYLVDDEKECLVSAAGANASGQIVVAEDQHLVPLDAQRSIIALAARTRETVIVNDVSEPGASSLDWLFPGTHSELAIPMMLGSRLLGIFDLQSEQINRFGDEELSVLKTLAEQIAIAVRNAQLFARSQAAQAAAETANRAKSVFLANMSHELRTPLNAILGFSQLMVRDASVSPAQREHLEIISRSGEYLLQLINDVLEMSKIEAGRTTLNVRSVDFFTLLLGLEEMFKVRAENKGLYLQFERAGDVPRYIQADEGKLRQVLSNLIGNAIKFTDVGGVIVRIQYNAEDQRLLFEVEDTGVGIEASEIKRLFEIFTQTRSGQRSQEGTGLGLPISRQFVRLMGGDISVESEPGRGALFAFDVRTELADASETHADVVRREVIGLTPNQPVYRILVVEDKWESRILLVKLLEPVGFEVRAAVNGQEAVELYEQWEPHLIFMDMQMPVMDGYETTRRIKSTPRGQATAIIALTASAFEHERAQILANGCDDFVCKPFRTLDIFDKIAQHVGAQFIYEDQVAAEIPGANNGGYQLTQETLASLPAAWVARLHQVARSAQAEEALALIDQIRAEYPLVADALKELVYTFRFDLIMSMTGQPVSD